MDRRLQQMACAAEVTPAPSLVARILCWLRHRLVPLARLTVRRSVEEGGEGGAVRVMTQQYIAGELSLLLGELEATIAGQVPARDVAVLRREAETTPLAALGWVAV